jgi:hypothetical protein
MLDAPTGGVRGINIMGKQCDLLMSPQNMRRNGGTYSYDFTKFTTYDILPYTLMLSTVSATRLISALYPLSRHLYYTANTSIFMALELPHFDMASQHIYIYGHIKASSGRGYG